MCMLGLSTWTNIKNISPPSSRKLRALMKSLSFCIKKLNMQPPPGVRLFFFFQMTCVGYISQQNEKGSISESYFFFFQLQKISIVHGLRAQKHMVINGPSVTFGMSCVDPLNVLYVCAFLKGYWSQTKSVEKYCRRLYRLYFNQSPESKENHKTATTTKRNKTWTKCRDYSCPSEEGCEWGENRLL